MRRLPNPHSLRGPTDARRPLIRPVRPPSPWRLLLLLIVVVVGIVFLLRRASGL
ncbi:MAG TPA: hypothetical protein VE913_05590 [Longimicrobium sp.]|nr:hypothetical protein [Longimicrobium sp.]